MAHRPITSDDLDSVYRIYFDAEANPFLDYEPMDRAAFRPIFDELVRAGDTALLVDGVHVLGTYRLHVQAHRCSHVATLGAFAMHPDFRGRGLGVKALEEIVLVARSRGVRRIELFVEADNRRAIRFYERQGFVREGVLRGSFRRRGDAADIDSFVMARILHG
jgi:RimJ/RimL family protein N-acetyltransferase